jgi:ribose transport system substrate-binding protein
VVFVSPEPQESEVFKIPLAFMQEAAADAMNSKLGISVSGEASSEHSADYQIKIIESYLRSGVDALIVHPADVAPVKPVLEKAIRSGIPVVLVNLLGAQQYSELGISSYIGFDNYTSGKLSAYATVDYLGGPGCLGSNKTESPSSDSYLNIDWYERIYQSMHNRDVSGNVVIIEGVSGSFTSSERLRGFKDVVNQFPGIIVKGIYQGLWKHSKAIEITEQILDKYSENEIDVIWAACNDMAFGVIEVLERNGILNQKQHPDAQGIAVITNDGTPKSLQMIEQGKIVAETWHGFPEWGWHGVEFAAKAVLGRPVPPIHDVVPRIEFSGNIAQFYPHPRLLSINWTT